METDYSVLTPESVEFRYELAGLGSRMLASLVDELVIAALFLLAWLIGVLVILQSLTLFYGAGIVIGLVGGFLANFGYFSILEWRWNGQTVGKRLLDIRVIDERGFSIDLFQSVIRNLLRVIDILPFPAGFYGVGGVAALTNPRLKRLGDAAAGTVVVRVRRRVIPHLILAPNEKYNTFQEDVSLRTRIRSRLDLEARDSLLQLCLRRHELELEARQQLFAEAARELEARLEVPRPEFLSEEKYVQNITAIAFIETPLRLRARPGTPTGGA